MLLECDLFLFFELHIVVWRHINKVYHFFAKSLEYILDDVFVLPF